MLAFSERVANAATLRGTNWVYTKAVVFVKTSLVKGRGTAQSAVEGFTPQFSPVSGIDYCLPSLMLSGKKASPKRGGFFILPFPARARGRD